MAAMLPSLDHLPWSRPWRIGADLPKLWRSLRQQQLLEAINRRESALLELADDQIRKQSLALRYRAKSGEPLDTLLVEAFSKAIVNTEALSPAAMSSSADCTGFLDAIKALSGARDS